jgi:hypothetical protein
VSNGGLTVTANAGGFQTSESSTALPDDTPCYFEIVLDTATGPNNFVGILSVSVYTQSGYYCGITATSWSYFGVTGDKSHSGSQSPYGATWTTGAVIGVLFYPATGNIYFCKNGIWQGTADGGSPVGKAPAYTGLTGTMYPAVSTFAAGTAMTARFIASDIPNTSHVPSGVRIGLIAAVPTAELFTHLVQQYALMMGDEIGAVSEQRYSLPATVGTTLEQLYSIILEIWLTQLYGDVSEIVTILAQPYKSVPTLTKALLQPWADALRLVTGLEQSWSMPGQLDAISEQRYGIVAEVLLKTSEQLYHINALTTLFAGLSQPYALAGEAAMIYYVDTKLFIDNVRIPYISCEWQDGGEYALSCEVVIKGAELAARCVDGVAMRIESAGETFHFKCVGGWKLDKRFGSEVYRVSGFSRTRDLDYGQPLLGNIPGGMASQIVADLAAPYGIGVDWQMADGYVAEGKVVANDETVLSVIRKIVWDAKGRVMSTPDGNLLIVAEVEDPVPDWSTVVPAATINARLERISTSEQDDIQPGYNRFVVSDQLAAGGEFNLEYQEIDATTREIRLFIVPIDGREFYLVTSGGEPVTVEPCGIVSLPVVDELVEVVAGSGRTQRPMYGISAMAWQRDNLGQISFTEDGLLTSEIASNSLLKISYLSRYHKWLGRDKNIESIQFIAHELEAAT